ncbi:MAG TPA: aminoglycoside phosphotransferase family protein [Candidatus Eisenbacteria bacterium]|jgi:hypothetical protein
MTRATGLETSTALDLDWLRTQMASCAFWPRDQVERVGPIEMLYSNLEPGRIIVLYRVPIRARGAARQVLYTGVVVPPAEVESLVRTLRRAARRRAPIGRAVIPLRDGHAALLAYPNDLTMRLPEGLGSARRLASRLSRRIDRDGRGAPRVEEASLELLRYVPERRWTARCRWMVADGTSGLGARTAIVKQFARPARAQRCFACLEAFGNGADQAGRPRVGFVADRPIRIPRALGATLASGVVSIESLPGRPLASQLEGAGLEPLMRGLGRSLAGFHRSEVALTRCWTPGDERRQIDEAFDAIAAAYPDLARRLDRLRPRLGRATDRHGPKGVLHGSLRLNHVLVHRGRFAFVDLDGARRGPPAYDIANLMASLYYLEAEERVSRAARRRIARFVMEGYASVAAEDVPTRTLLGFVADLLVAKQALKYATRLRQDRRRRLERMLDLAEEISMLASRPTAAAAAWKVMP